MKDNQRFFSLLKRIVRRASGRADLGGSTDHDHETIYFTRRRIQSIRWLSSSATFTLLNSEGLLSLPKLWQNFRSSPLSS